MITKSSFPQYSKKLRQLLDNLMSKNFDIQKIKKNMNSYFYPTEVPSTLLCDDIQYSSFGQKVFDQSIEDNLISKGAILSPYILAYRSSKNRIELWCLLNTRIRTSIEDDDEILDFVFLQIKNQRIPSNFETIATINIQGNIKIYEIGLGDNLLENRQIDQTTILIQSNETLKMFYYETSLMLFIQQSCVIILQKKLPNQQLQWNSFSKQCSDIIDISWSRQLRLFFVVFKNNKLVLYDQENFDLKREVKMSNYYQQRNVFVTQIALFENILISTNELENQLDTDYKFITLSNLGELVIWQMLDYNVDSKLYKKLESLDLNYQSEIAGSSQFFNGDRHIQMEMNNLGHILFIFGVNEENCLACFFVQITEDESFLRFQNVKMYLSDYTTHSILLNCCVHKDNQQSDYLNTLQSDIPSSIRNIEEFQTSSNISDPHSQSYLFVTFNKECVNFHWVFGENLFTTKQTYQKTNDHISYNSDIVELVRSKQIANSPLPNIPLILQNQLIKTQEKELLQDPNVKVHSESFKESKQQMENQREFEQDIQVDKNFLQMLIKDIAEDKLFLQLVNQNVIKELVQDDYNVKSFKDQLVSSYNNQFKQIESTLEHTLSTHLDMTTQYCETILSECFSHEQISSLVTQTFDELFVFGHETQNLIQQSTQQFYESQILPQYKQELITLSLNVTLMMNRTTQLFKETEIQDTIKLKTLKEFLYEIKDHLNNLVSAVNKLNVKQYNETQQDLLKMWQKINDTQNQLENWQTKNPNPIVPPQIHFQQTQMNNTSYNQRQDQGSSNVMSTMTQLSILQQQLTSPNAITVKNLHQILSQLIAQLQIYLISCER